MDFIDLKTQQARIRPELDRRMAAVLEHGRYIMGPEVAEMEERLCAFTGAKHCISVSSGTDALLMSLMALDIGPGDEVITTPFTFIATAEVIVRLGAVPVYVDVEPDTCNIDVRLVEQAITEKTRAIMPVSLYGQPADMAELNAIAAGNGNIAVIEDAAQSLGARYRNAMSGNIGTIGCTSFFPSKPLGCYGDGGAIFTNNDDLAEACRQIRVHGQSARYIHTRIGIGGRMDTLQCAVVLAKLDIFADEVSARGEIGARYNRLFDEAGIARVQQRPDRTSVFAQYTIFTPERDKAIEALKQHGIPHAVHYPLPVNRQTAYAVSGTKSETPVADRLAQQVLSVPMHPYLDAGTQRTVVDALRS